MLRAGIMGIATVLGLSALVAFQFPLETRQEAGSQPIVLWAWERPERLGFIDPSDVEVAVLVGTIGLTADSIQTYPRQQPLELPRATRRTAVVRIEETRIEELHLENQASPALTPGQRRQTVAAILAWARSSRGYTALQIDFDATVSQRTFYRHLLEDLRRELPPTMPISITALASWCLGDPWFEDLPIDEAIPMLFRMGTDEPAIRAALSRGDDFSDPRCRTSYGLATDELRPLLRPDRRLFLFHPEPWTEDAFRAFLQGLPGDVSS